MPTIGTPVHYNPSTRSRYKLDVPNIINIIMGKILSQLTLIPLACTGNLTRAYAKRVGSLYSVVEVLVVDVRNRRIMEQVYIITIFLSNV